MASMSELNEQMIELTIEALTGTVYDLCVSPFETILGIKMKIQRLEGSYIPAMYQPIITPAPRDPGVPAAAGSREHGAPR